LDAEHKEFLGSPLTFLALFNDGTDAWRKTFFIESRKLPAEEAGISHATHAWAARRYYCEENSVFKAAACGLNDKAWNNKGSTGGSTLLLVFKIRLDNMWVESSTFAFWLLRSSSEHGINGGCRGKTYRSVRGEILRPLWDELMRRHFPSIPSSIKN
jgi:hypothetical protein